MWYMALNLNIWMTDKCSGIFFSATPRLSRMYRESWFAGAIQRVNGERTRIFDLSECEGCMYKVNERKRGGIQIGAAI